ncbi:succinate dehydrogenase hydrophobic membrane anchor subunit [Taylorella asinigenitalis 14/45]|uniref:Succinate dehydrogenase hydrophobic membrane anchor subunit n=1 Tax=Taylorella asinigenitalis 14/45 TaxID=1091495 RepID=I7IBQ9_9BURK|nr:succinate dehydrogenase, hydrophobic membrane anchor protein [Taylorella asinigenitalis]CCG19229.1 succinate dehydrogenase hydrophobic membrane anchor subunit [Taylorella asinigenitalis 14/45]
MPDQFGTNRRAVGAHYGTIGFIVQRLTATLLAIYSVFFLLTLLFTPVTYENWLHLFTFTVLSIPAGQICVTLVFFTLAWHAWIGIRDVWMDYIDCWKLRLILFIFTIFWLIAMSIYFSFVVWSL